MDCGGKMTHSERCNQDALERISVCCGAAEHEYMVEFCSRCNNGAGFELWCSDCGEVVEETASPSQQATAERSGIEVVTETVEPEEERSRRL